MQPIQHRRLPLTPSSMPRWAAISCATVLATLALSGIAASLAKDRLSHRLGTLCIYVAVTTERFEVTLRSGELTVTAAVQLRARAERMV